MGGGRFIVSVASLQDDTKQRRITEHTMLPYEVMVKKLVDHLVEIAWSRLEMSILGKSLPIS